FENAEDYDNSYCNSTNNQRQMKIRFKYDNRIKHSDDHNDQRYHCKKKVKLFFRAVFKQFFIRHSAPSLVDLIIHKESVFSIVYIFNQHRTPHISFLVL